MFSPHKLHTIINQHTEITTDRFCLSLKQNKNFIYLISENDEPKVIYIVYVILLYIHTVHVH
jgi:hypothetical protein